jgi:hypothetical protein
MGIENKFGWYQGQWCFTLGEGYVVIENGAAPLVNQRKKMRDKEVCGQNKDSFLLCSTSSQLYKGVRRIQKRK